VLIAAFKFRSRRKTKVCSSHTLTELSKNSIIKIIKVRYDVHDTFGSVDSFRVSHDVDNRNSHNKKYLK